MHFSSLLSWFNCLLKRFIFSLCMWKMWMRFSIRIRIRIFRICAYSAYFAYFAYAWPTLHTTRSQPTCMQASFRYFSQDAPYPCPKAFCLVKVPWETMVPCFDRAHTCTMYIPSRSVKARYLVKPWYLVMAMMTCLNHATSVKQGTLV